MSAAFRRRRHGAVSFGERNSDSQSRRMSRAGDVRPTGDEAIGGSRRPHGGDQALAPFRALPGLHVQFGLLRPKTSRTTKYLPSGGILKPEFSSGHTFLLANDARPYGRRSGALAVIKPPYDQTSGRSIRSPFTEKRQSGNRTIFLERGYFWCHFSSNDSIYWFASKYK